MIRLRYTSSGFGMMTVDVDGPASGSDVHIHGVTQGNLVAVTGIVLPGRMGEGEVRCAGSGSGLWKYLRPPVDSPGPCSIWVKVSNPIERRFTDSVSFKSS
jgi:hypothetical protein